MFKKSIVVKLMLLFFSVGIIAMTFTGLYAFFKSKNAILNRVFEQLTSISVIKKSEIEFYFSEQYSKLNLLSNSLDVAHISDLIMKNSKNLPDSISTFSNIFNSNIIIAKKLSNENFCFYRFRNGTYYMIKNISLTNNLNTYCFNLLNSKEPLITDFIKQSLQDTLPMLYLGKIINFNEYKNELILLIGISVNDINNIMLEKSKENGLGNSGEAYIVGNDLLMRSNSRFICNSVLQTKVNTSSVRNALNNLTGTDIIYDYRSIKCLSAYSNIKIFNLNWAIIAEIDYNEAIIPITNIRNDLFIISSILALFILSLAAIISKTITQPLINLKNAAFKIGAGNQDVEIEVKQKDEIGLLANAIQEMSHKLKFERINRMSSIYDGQEIERQRISRELHDGLGQMMVALKFKIEILANNCSNENKNELENISKQLSAIIDETRQISSNLAPSGLNEFGLIPIISMLCNETQQSTGLKITFSHTGDFNNIESKTSSYLFRIIQEAISNTVRHSKAKNLEIHLMLNENNLIVFIEDNGEGFSFSENKFQTGNGLFNIRERVRLLNGSFNIETQTGIGTTIRIKVPVK